MASVDASTRIPLVDNPFSTYGFKYLADQTQPSNSTSQAVWGLINAGLSMEAAKSYQDVVISKTTRRCRKSEGGFKDVNTELFGTSPYLGRGDGERFNMPTSNELLREFGSSNRGSKVKTQINDKSPIPYTWAVIDVPLAVSTTKFMSGEDTRGQGIYVSN